MAETKVTDNEIINRIVSSSNLGSRTQAVTPSAGASLAYSTNNPTITLKPGRYLLIATAAAKVVVAAQDSTFYACVYDNTGAADLVANGTSSTGSSVTIWPFYSAQAVVTLTANNSYSGCLRQSYGSGAAYTFVNSSLIAIPI